MLFINGENDVQVRAVWIHICIGLDPVLLWLLSISGKYLKRRDMWAKGLGCSWGQQQKIRLESLHRLTLCSYILQEHDTDNSILEKWYIHSNKKFKIDRTEPRKWGSMLYPQDWSSLNLLAYIWYFKCSWSPGWHPKNMSRIWCLGEWVCILLAWFWMYK